VAEGVAGLLRWHFSPQYFTASQLLRHFLRYSKGSPHVAQILVGSWPFLRVAAIEKERKMQRQQTFAARSGAVYV
jgi:hypothetical protein